jgi:hypothetical protein
MFPQYLKVKLLHLLHENIHKKKSYDVFVVCTSWRQITDVTVFVRILVAAYCVGKVLLAHSAN